MLESRLLLSFVVLAEDLHFGRAAERLDVAQSALSGSIRRLEDTMGVTLFERGGRTAVRLTRAGTMFLDEARASLARLDQAERLGRLAGRGEAGPLSIGYVFSAAMCGLLPRLLHVLRDRLPLLDARPQQMETPEQLAALGDGRLDIGLVRPRPSYSPLIAARVIHREPLSLAMAEGHPLAAHAIIDPRDLAHEKFIMPAFPEKTRQEQTGLIDHLHRLAARGGFVLGDVRHVSDFVTALALAGGGYGVVLAPRSLARMAMPGVVFRNLPQHEDAIELALAWRENAIDPITDRALAAIGDLAVPMSGTI